MPAQSLARRLALRECQGAPPGAVTPHSRRLYENLVPDTAVPGVAPPPNTVLCCFTPCGHFLIAFHPISNEVVAYRFKGLHVGITASQQRQQQQQQGQPAAAATHGGAAGSAAPQPQPAHSSHSTAGAPAAAHHTGQPQPQQQQHAAQAQAAQGQQAEQPRQVLFGDVFEEHWRCCPCPGRQEQISPEFCIVAHRHLLMVATASPERAPAGGARGASQLLPAVESTTLHLIDVESGSLLDSHTIHSDYVELARNQGTHLRGQRLLVLGLASQTLYVLQVLPEGRFMFLHAIGQHCRDDDGWVIAQQEERERRLRQQQRWRGRQRQQAPAAATLHAPGSFPSLADLASGGPAVPLPRQLLEGVHPGRPGAAGTTAAAARAPQHSGSEAGSEDGDMDDDEEVAAHSPGAGRRGGGAQRREATSPLITGLKQCLLARLFAEAQQQSQAAAAAAADAATACAAAPAAGSLHRVVGSTGSLPSAAAAAAPPLGLHRTAGSGGSLLGLAAHGGPSAGLGSGGGNLTPYPHWRRPLDRFYYYFEAHMELLMWKAQLLDDHRLLIHWCPPELLAGPHRHQHHGPAPSSSAAGQQGSYLMLYNVATAAVEQLLVAHSPQLAAWYLQHPAAFHSGGCACGCGSDWERWVAPSAASRVAREQHRRDPQLAAKARACLVEACPARPVGFRLAGPAAGTMPWCCRLPPPSGPVASPPRRRRTLPQELRHRLAEELPASSQLRQATPYLDPDLYCFDERSIGGAIRPHHPPHRSIKFMCRCQPERLRFRLDPEQLQAAAAGGRGGGGGAARHHVVYLFHPVQPFLLAVMQDIESGMAECLTLFTRL